MTLPLSMQQGHTGEEQRYSSTHSKPPVLSAISCVLLSSILVVWARTAQSVWGGRSGHRIPAAARFFSSV